MNIFVLDTHPQAAAEMQCDKHVVKMVLETAQLLCSVFAEGEAPYKQTHVNHPCSKWVRESFENYKWLLDHGRALAKEYTLRYGKVHKSQAVINWCADNVARCNLPRESKTPFPQCMPDIYRNDDVVQAYRDYYIGEKQRFAKWMKSRKQPTWWALGESIEGHTHVKNVQKLTSRVGDRRV